MLHDGDYSQVALRMQGEPTAICNSQGEHVKYEPEFASFLLTGFSQTVKIFTLFQGPGGYFHESTVFGEKDL